MLRLKKISKDNKLQHRAYFYFYFPVMCSILNMLTPEKFDVLKGQLIDAGISSQEILKVLVLLIVEE